uniref:Uncharacterized protein n=1 Tax=viral metagenome TaxID=1070528 RepID=A0A6C0EIY5_9ZZZZ
MEANSYGKSFDLCKNSAYIQLLNKQVLFINQTMMLNMVLDI